MNILITVNQYTVECTKILHTTVKPVLSGHPKRRLKIGFQDRLSLNATIH